jgi:hypothetical protein
MTSFNKYLEDKGVKDIKSLTHFIRNFFEEPTLFFDLTEDERVEMEKKLDEALLVFKNEKIDLKSEPESSPNELT